MRTTWISAAAAAALLISASAASAAVLRFQTTSTFGTFDNGLTTDPNDTSAAFSFDISFSSPTRLVISDGVFTDSNTVLSGVPERAVGFEAVNVNPLALSVNLENPDAAVLELTATQISPTIEGTYLFGGPEGEIASGTFVATVFPVPLPESSFLLGMALAALGWLGFATRSRSLSLARQYTLSLISSHQRFRSGPTRRPGGVAAAPR